MTTLQKSILYMLFLFTSFAYASAEEGFFMGGSCILYVLFMFLLPKKPSMSTKVDIFYILAFLLFFMSDIKMEKIENYFLKYYFYYILFFTIMFIVGGIIFYKKQDMKNIIKQYCIYLSIIFLYFYIQEVKDISIYSVFLFITSIIFFLIVSLNNALQKKYILIIMMGIINILPTFLLNAYTNTINKEIELLPIWLSLNVLSIYFIHFKLIKKIITIFKK